MLAFDSPAEVFRRLSSALLTEAAPSCFFETLRDENALLPYFPEVLALDRCEQSPFWHPEGNAFVHTMAVIDAGAALREEAEHPLAFMLACLMHDYGKPLTTKRLPDGRLTCKGHAPAGKAPAEEGLRRLGAEELLIESVVDHVGLHLDPLEYFERNASPEETRALLASSRCPHDLLLLSRADGLGSGHAFPPEKDAYWAERYEDFLVFSKGGR